MKTPRQILAEAGMVGPRPLAESDAPPATSPYGPALSIPLVYAVPPPALAPGVHGAPLPPPEPPPPGPPVRRPGVSPAMPAPSPPPPQPDDAPDLDA
jgi:hypothetical protein